LIITEIRKLLNGVILLHLKRTPTSSSCNFGEGEEEAACAAMCRLLQPAQAQHLFPPQGLHWDSWYRVWTECQCVRVGGRWAEAEQDGRMAVSGPWPE